MLPNMHLQNLLGFQTFIAYAAGVDLVMAFVWVAVFSPIRPIVKFFSAYVACKPHGLDIYDYFRRFGGRIGR